MASTVTNYRIFSQKGNSNYTGDRFPGGIQDYEILLTGNRAINMKDSYFSYRIKLQNSSGLFIGDADNLSLNMNVIACLYSDATVYMNGEAVEAIHDYLPQLQAFKVRSSTPAAQLNGALGFRECWAPTMEGEVAQTSPFRATVESNRAIMTQEHQFNEICWRPPLSIFDNDTPIHNVKIRISLTAKDAQSVAKNIIESHSADKNTPGDFRFSIDRIRFHAAIYEYDTNFAEPYEFVLHPAIMQSKVLPGPEDETTTFLSNHNPEVIGVAFQDTRAGTNTLHSRSKFKVNEATPGLTEQFKPGEEHNLTLLAVSHAGIERPNENDSLLYDDALVAGAQNFLQRYYTSTNIQTRGYYADVEPYEDWLRRGMYFMWSWPKAGGERVRRIDVRTKFSQPFTVSPPRLFLYASYTIKVKVVPEVGGNTAVIITDF